MCAKTRVSERTVSSFCSLACMNVNSCLVGTKDIETSIIRKEAHFHGNSISHLYQGKVIYRTYTIYISIEGDREGERELDNVLYITFMGG